MYLGAETKSIGRAIGLKTWIILSHTFQLDLNPYSWAIRFSFSGEHVFKILPDRGSCCSFWHLIQIICGSRWLFLQPFRCLILWGAHSWFHWALFWGRFCCGSDTAGITWEGVMRLIGWVGNQLLLSEGGRSNRRIWQAHRGTSPAAWPICDPGLHLDHDSEDTMKNSKT